LRYSGKAASFGARFSRCVPRPVFNCVIMAAVNLAARRSPNRARLALEKTHAAHGRGDVFFASALRAVGVLVTDSIQFGITMTATLRCVFALSQPQVGRPLRPHRPHRPKRLRLIPDFGDWGLRCRC